MKKNTYSPKLLYKAILITTSLFVAFSCSTEKKPEDSKEMAEDRNEAKFEKTNKEKDAEFLVNVAEINLEEIKLGYLAQEKSGMKDVKELGKMMETAHSKGLKNLTELAAKKAITIPTSVSKGAEEGYEKLKAESGLQFDKDYCAAMVRGHKDAIAMFEKASAEAEDADIREMATKTIPELNMHLEHAIACQKKCEKMK
ncbi:MAG TPA: DUF4142 domain-containing protein [Cytophagaceae bacterium]|jgi:putative membrane protein|nr:DUF4142 domain-containing protein [Cytophagaceae bacterium]